MWQLLGPQAVCVTENSWRPSHKRGGPAELGELLQTERSEQLSILSRRARFLTDEEGSEKYVKG